MDITCYLPPNGSVPLDGVGPFVGISLLLVDTDVWSTPLLPQVVTSGVASLLVVKGC